MLHPQGSSASLTSTANSSTSKSWNKDLHTKYLAQLLKGSSEITVSAHSAMSKQRSWKRKQQKNSTSKQRIKRYFAVAYCKGRQTATRQMLNTTSLQFSNTIPDGKYVIFKELTQLLLYFC